MRVAWCSHDRQPASTDRVGASEARGRDLGVQGLPTLHDAVTVRLRGLLHVVMTAIGSLTLRGPRATLAVATAFAVGGAVLLALALRLQAPYWAGISGFICMQASQPQSLRKALHRMWGTALGAAVALLVFPWIAYDHAATMLLLFVAGTLAILGSLLSRFSYAWLLGGITTVMVILGALNDPSLIMSFAFYRSAEITLGSVTALAVAYMLLPRSGQPVAPAPGWGSLFGHNRHALRHAMRTGVIVALVPLVWRVFDLPNLSQMAISIGAIMAVPELTGDPGRDQRAIADRAAQRVFGCVIGAGAGLVMLTMPWLAVLPPWLLCLMVAAAVGSELQTGPRAVPTVGTQAVVAFILTVVQGWGPPLSLLPAIDRAAGMFGALALLFTANMLLGPPRALAGTLH
jgi:uncharacterized membrane protein YccC